MVSVADEGGGKLVLMGVDATYCVVDEVDTTSSTLQDAFLQEAIQTSGHDSMCVEESPDKLNDPVLQEAIRTTAKHAIKVADQILKRSKRKRKQPTRNKDFEYGDILAKSSRHSDTAKTSKEDDVQQTAVDENANETSVDKNAKDRFQAETAEGTNSQKGSKTKLRSSFLRAALLCKPVSLREPGTAGKLNFCQEQTESIDDGAELPRRGDSPPESEGSPNGLPSLSGGLSSPLNQESSPSNEENASVSHPEEDEAVQEKAAGSGGCEKSDDGAQSSQTDEEKIGKEPSDKDGDADGKKEAKPKKPRSREKNYQCGVCERWFGCKSHVVEHMRTHTGEKPFKCPLCDRCFSQKSNIYQHMNTHTLERPFRCDDCGKAFMYRGSLYKHKRLHTGERPYCCGICNWRFTHASQLFEHIRTHTNEKPYECGVCGRAFAHSGTMHRHQRNHFTRIMPKEDTKPSTSEDGEENGKSDSLQDMMNDTESNSETCDTTRSSAENGEADAGTDSDLGRLAGPTQVADGASAGSAHVNKVNDPKSQIDTQADSCEQVVLSSEVNSITNSKTSGNGKVVKHTAATVDKKKNAEKSANSSSIKNEKQGTAGSADDSTHIPVEDGSAQVSEGEGEQNTSSNDPQKVFSCDVCGKTFAHKRSVRRHKVSVHEKGAASASGGQAEKSNQEKEKSKTLQPSAELEVTVPAVSSSGRPSDQSEPVGSKNNHSVIRLLLSRKPTEQDDSSYVSRLIFGNCEPPAVPQIRSLPQPVVEQNNNITSPALLKDLLAKSTTNGLSQEVLLQTILQRAVMKTEPDSGDEFSVERSVEPGHSAQRAQTHSTFEQVEQSDQVIVKQEPPGDW